MTMTTEEARETRAQIARRLGQLSFIDFVRSVAPWFIVEEAHLLIAEKLEKVARGETDRLMIFLPPRTGKPVDEETLVLRGDGRQVPLWAIKVGDTVITDRGRPRRVTEVHEQGTLPVRRIRTVMGREVRAAYDHPFLTTRGWVQAGNLQTRDVLAVPNGVETEAPSGLSDEGARMLGYIVGDGNVTNATTSIACNVTCADPVQGADIIHCADSLGFVAQLRGRRQLRYTMSKGAREFVRSHGLAGKGSYTKRVPDAVMRGGLSAVANFVGAYFACDGSISRRANGRGQASIEFGSVSRELLQDVQHLLMRLGVSARLRERAHDFNGEPYQSFRLIVGGEHNVALFARSVPVYGVKADKLRDWCGDPRTFHAPWFEDEIVEIVDDEQARCRCLTVDEDHTFLANDLVVHNSMLCSIFFPAWWVGKFPSDKVMQVAYEHEMAVGWGRQIRNMIRDPDYQEVFPGVDLASDSKAAGKWGVVDRNQQDKAQQGEYVSAGIRGGIAGKGWNLGIIDDPLSEQDAMSDTAKQFVWEWYGPGFYTRRQPDRNAVVLIMTRWAKDDLAGKLLELANQNKDDPYADQWDVLNIPAILDDDNVVSKLNSKARETYEINRGIERAQARKQGRPEKKVPFYKFKQDVSFAPRRWPIGELLRTKSNMRPKWWRALYMGQPAEEEGHILKRQWWKKWPQPTPPECEMIVAFYDTAMEEAETDDFSARTTWGVFSNPLTGRYSVILLERMNKRLAFPDLVDAAIQHHRNHEPDMILVEKRASGHSLIQTLRRKGLPVKKWLPPGGTHSKGKLPRAHAASDILEEGLVYYMDRDWAEEVIEQCADFPYGEFDDLVDTVTMCLLWLRKSFLEFADEADEEDDTPEPGTSVVGGVRRLYG
jgi:predicted phage terminase large subunit-like protein